MLCSAVSLASLRRKICTEAMSAGARAAFVDCCCAASSEEKACLLDAAEEEDARSRSVLVDADVLGVSCQTRGGAMYVITGSFES